MAIRFYAWKEKHKRKKRSKFSTEWFKSGPKKKLAKELWQKHRIQEKKAFQYWYNDYPEEYCYFPFPKKEILWWLY